MMQCTTFIYERMSNGQKREMTIIHSASKFWGFKIPKNIKETQETADSQAWIARMFKYLWVFNGDKDPMKILIEQHIFELGFSDIRVVD